MEYWRKIWREALLPRINNHVLQQLQQALECFDQELTTKTTVVAGDSENPIEKACLIGYIGWKQNHLNTASAVEEFFQQTCADIDFQREELAATSYLTNWYDNTPWLTVRNELMREIARAIHQRSHSCSVFP